MSARGRIRSWFARAARWLVRNELVSISDPRLIQWLTGDRDGTLSESKALTLSAFYRGVLIVSGSIGGLPLRTMRDVGGTRTRVNSVFDNPGDVAGLRPYNWKQIQVLHLLLWGDAFLRHYYNALGALVGLVPVHPSCVRVEWDPTAVGGKRYRFRDNDGNMVELDATGMTQIMGPSLDGLRGMSVLTLARRSLGGAIAADQAAAKMWKNGMMLSALVTPEDEPEDGDDDELNSKLGGVENAGMIRTVNRRLKVQPLSMPAKDAQFLESRQFGIQEVARWLGVPASLLMDPGSVSTWGTGVEIQQRGLSRFTLPQFTLPMQEAYTSALRGVRFCEFDFAGLERGSPQEEITLLIQQVEGGMLTINEARRIRNLPPVPGGDVLRLHGQPVTEGEPISEEETEDLIAGAENLLRSNATERTPELAGV